MRPRGCVCVLGTWQPSKFCEHIFELEGHPHTPPQHSLRVCSPPPSPRSCTASTPTIDAECQMLLLAKDGVYLPTAPRAIQHGMLASGNRADVLINCPEGNFTFRSVAKNDDGDPINGTLLHIVAIPSPSSPPQCDLPVFEVNRPCCDWPPFEPCVLGSSNVHTSADPPACSPPALSRPRRPARPGGGKELDV